MILIFHLCNTKTATEQLANGKCEPKNTYARQHKLLYLNWNYCVIIISVIILWATEMLETRSSKWNLITFFVRQTDSSLPTQCAYVCNFRIHEISSPLISCQLFRFSFLCIQSDREKTTEKRRKVEETRDGKSTGPTNKITEHQWL